MSLVQRLRHQADYRHYIRQQRIPRDSIKRDIQFVRNPPYSWHQCWYPYLLLSVRNLFPEWFGKRLATVPVGFCIYLRRIHGRKRQQHRDGSPVRMLSLFVLLKKQVM